MFLDVLNTKFSIPEENMKLVLNKLTLILLRTNLWTLMTIYFAFPFKKPIFYNSIFHCKHLYELAMRFSGNNLQNSTNLSTSGAASETTPTKTKKLFVTGMLQIQFWS